MIFTPGRFGQDETLTGSPPVVNTIGMAFAGRGLLWQQWCVAPVATIMPVCWRSASAGNPVAKRCAQRYSEYRDESLNETGCAQCLKKHPAVRVLGGRLAWLKPIWRAGCARGKRPRCWRRGMNMVVFLCRSVAHPSRIMPTAKWDRITPLIGRSARLHGVRRQKVSLFFCGAGGRNWA